MSLDAFALVVGVVASIGLPVVTQPLQAPITPQKRILLSVGLVTLMVLLAAFVPLVTLAQAMVTRWSTVLFDSTNFVQALIPSVSVEGKVRVWLSLPKTQAIKMSLVTKPLEQTISRVVVVALAAKAPASLNATAIY